MIFADELKNLRLGKRPVVLPICDKDKTKGYVSFLLTPNPESSLNLLHNNIINKKYYKSYFIEKDIMYFINQEGYIEDSNSEVLNEHDLSSKERKELSNSEFGIPEERKYPLTDKNHVLSAMRYFDKCDPKYKKELAKRIVKRAKELDMSINVKSDYYKIANEEVDYNEEDYNDHTNSLMLEYVITHKKDYKKNPHSLSEYTRKKITSSILRKYGYEYPHLRTIISGDEYDGYIWIDSSKNKVVGWVNMDCTDHRLQAFEITDDYKSQGLAKQIYYNIKDEFQVTNIYINSDNNLAISILSSLGFKKNISTPFITQMVTNDYVEEKSEYKVGNYLNESYSNISDIDNIQAYLGNGRTIVFGFNDDKTEFVNEDKSYNNKLRKFLYDDRFKTPSEVVAMYRDVEAENETIINYFLKIEKYKSKNLLLDLGYYHNSFFSNMNLPMEKIAPIYIDFLNRLINDTRLDKFYTNKLVVIPLMDWRRYFPEINPITIFKYLIRKRKEEILDPIKNIDFLLVTNTGYMKFNLGELDMAKLSLFNQLEDKLIKKDIIIDPDDDTEKVITAKVIDKIESGTHITIHNLTGKSDDKEKDDIVNTVKNAAKQAKTEDDVYNKIDKDDDYIKTVIATVSDREDPVSINASRLNRMENLNKTLEKEKIRNIPIKEMISKKEEKLPETKLNIDAPSEDWNHLTFTNLNKTYNITDDVIKILYFFTKKENVSIPISIINIDVQDTSTPDDLIDTYTVSCEDIYGQRFKLIFDVPKPKDNNFMFLRGNEKTISNQLMLIPISKTDVDTVQIVSNYKKIFIRTYGREGKVYKTEDLLCKALEKCIDKSYIKITYGNNRKISHKYPLPVDYIDMSLIYSKLETKRYVFYFNQDELYKKHKDQIDEKNGIPFGYDKNNKSILYYISGTQSFSDVLLIIMMGDLGNTDFSDIYNSCTPSKKYTYSKASILNTTIPLVVVLGYTEGLLPILNKAEIKYMISDKRTKNSVYTEFIKFNDGYLYYENSMEASLLMNGLIECNTEEYSIKDINSKEMFLGFLDLFGGRILADGLENFKDLMIDPLTQITLERYGLPDNYIDLMVYANKLLSNSRYIKHVSLESNRFRSNEIISGYTYMCLATSYGQYKNSIRHNKKGPMTIKKSAIIDAVLADPTSSDNSPLSDLNIAEAQNAVSFKGLSGMNSDRSYGLEKRTYDKSMVNILGLSTGFAGNVGLTRQATIDSNIDSTRGYLKIDSDPNKMSIAKTFTFTEGVNPMSSTHDDPFRTAMTFIQSSKHAMRTKKGYPKLVTNGTDQAMPYLSSNTFSFKAAEDGTIVDMNDEYIVLKYKSGKTDFINIGNKVAKNSNGGFYLSIQLKTDKKKGYKFKKGEILAYDPSSYSDVIGTSDNISFVVGPLVKAVVMTSDEGYEDSTIISEYLSDAMTSIVDIKQDVLLDKNCNVFDIVKKGQKVKEGQNLILYQNAYEDNDVNLLLKNLAADEKQISDLGRIPVKSEVEGEVVDVVLYRTVDKNELSESLKKLANDLEGPIKKNKEFLKKNNISNYEIIGNTDKVEAIGKMKKCEGKVKIEFTLSYEDKMSIGDKLVNDVAAKGVAKQIFPKGKEPRSSYRPTENIDIIESLESLMGRIVTSIFIIGGTNKFLIELGRQVKDMCGIPWKFINEY